MTWPFLLTSAPFFGSQNHRRPGPPKRFFFLRVTGPLLFPAFEWDSGVRSPPFFFFFFLPFCFFVPMKRCLAVVFPPLQHSRPSPHFFSPLPTSYFHFASMFCAPFLFFSFYPPPSFRPAPSGEPYFCLLFSGCFSCLPHSIPCQVNLYCRSVPEATFPLFFRGLCVSFASPSRQWDFFSTTNVGLDFPTFIFPHERRSRVIPPLLLFSRGLDN